jgi:hypothetical protein
MSTVIPHYGTAYLKTNLEKVWTLTLITFGMCVKLIGK